jgi:hypothetical protein
MYRTSKYLVSIQKCYVFRFANILGASPPGHLKRDSRPPGALSGTPLHWHNDAMNYLVRGAKLWTLEPPSAARRPLLAAARLARGRRAARRWPRLPLRPGAFCIRSRHIRRFSIGSMCSHFSPRPRARNAPSARATSSTSAEESAAYAHVRKMLGRL